MSIQLDHLIVPSKDRVAAARQLGKLLGVPWAEQGNVGPFSPVYVSTEHTIDFDQWEDAVPKLHYCFRVGESEFEAILARIKESGIAFRSLPHGPDDSTVNRSFEGKIVYWSEPDGHVWELLTVSYERQSTTPTPRDAPNTFGVAITTMALSSPFPAQGGCDCRAVRYRVESPPLVVHCCHCRWCQRESGAAFALNAMIEADRVTSLGVDPEIIDTPSESGSGQRIARCPSCKVAVWSNYSAAGPVVKFIRVGTLDNPDLLPPDVHIFAASKQPWVQLPAGTPVFSEYYQREQVWSSGSLERRKALLPLIEAYRASQRGDA